MENGKRTSRLAPDLITDRAYTFAAFADGKVLPEKKCGRLPAMGWNSWNAFGSGNTQALTKQMADAMIELDLDQVGYEYLVLDDGCYRTERVDGLLSNEEHKFPGALIFSRWTTAIICGTMPPILMPPMRAMSTRPI